MMETGGQKLSLDRPARYQIKVYGHLDESWAGWIEGMTIRTESREDGPLTVLTGRLDQAALQGLLRRLYAVGLPLASAICLDCGLEIDDLFQHGKDREGK